MLADLVRIELSRYNGLKSIFVTMNDPKHARISPITPNCFINITDVTKHNTPCTIESIVGNLLNFKAAKNTTDTLSIIINPVKNT